jgi:putative DNA primase/helicase
MTQQHLHIAGNNLRAALKYLRLGWYPIPICWPVKDERGEMVCGCGMGHTDKDVGKAPLLGKGYQTLRPTQAEVEAWWTRWPAANIAVLIEPSGLIVVDPDSPEAIAEAQALGLPPTATVRSGKGEHHYYERPPGVPAGRKTKGGTSGKLDVLARGYVLVPPSLHLYGVRYTWTSAKGVSPQPPPKWVTDWLTPKTPVAPPPGSAASPPRRFDLDDEARDWILAVDALRTIPADTHLDEWLAAGMALHSKWPSSGLDLWDSWSRTGGPKYHTGECARRWQTFRASGRTLATLFDLAKRYGWRFPERETAPLRPPPRPPAHTDEDAPAWVSAELAGGAEPPDPDAPPVVAGLGAAAGAVFSVSGEDDEDGACFFLAGFGDEPIHVDFEADAAKRAEQEQSAAAQRAAQRAEREAQREAARLAAAELYAQILAHFEGLERNERKAAVFPWLKSEPLFTACAADPKGFAELLLQLDDLGGCTKARLDLLAEKVRAGAGALEQQELRQDVEALEIPVEGLVIPLGYTVSARGVAKTVSLKSADGAATTGQVLITQAPILVLGVAHDVHDATQSVTLGWRVGERWTLRDVPRDQIASGRAIVELARYGAPVTSQNAGEVVEFLARQEAQNLPTLPRERTSGRLGWQGGGFLWGQEFLGDEGGEGLAFRPAEAGEAQLGRACRRKGTLEGWLAAANALAPYPYAAALVYASLAACLLELTGADNFIVDVACTTSTGKSKALSLAGAAWGCAVERDDEGTLFNKWNSKATFIERAMACTTGLPFLLDDTKLAPNPEHIAATLYAVASGRGKGRGTTGGIAATTATKTILLSTSESPAINATRDGGTRARTLTLWGLPFGGVGAQTRPIVQFVSDSAEDHYGHAGPALAEFLARHRAMWPEWREHYRARREDWAASAGDDSVRARLAGHVALLELAGHLAGQAFGLNLPVEKHLNTIWTSVSAESSDAAGAQGAMMALWGWTQANRAGFHDPSFKTVGSPVGGWLGQRGTPDGLLLLFPHVLESFFEKHGYGLELLRVWRDNGWLAVDADRARLQTRRRVDGERSYVYALRVPEIAAALGVDEAGLKREEEERERHQVAT